MESYAFFLAERFGEYQRSQSNDLKDERPASITATNTFLAGNLFEIFNASYDLKTNTQVFGYYEDILVYLDYYFTKKEYQIFYSKDHHIALFNTSHTAATKMVKDIKVYEYKSHYVEESMPIKLKTFPLNNRLLAENGVFEDMKIAWIKVNKANLKSATLSGNNLNADTVYEDLIQDGSLSAAKVSITINDQTYDCILSEKGSFTIITNIPEGDTDIRVLLFQRLISILNYLK